MAPRILYMSPLLAALGCGSGISTGIPVELVARPAVPGTQLVAEPVDAPQPSGAVGLFGGAAAIGTFGGLVASAAGGTVAAVPGENAGAVAAIARRADGSLLVAASNGIFEGRSGALAKSALSSAVRGLALASLDVYGAGAAEEVWLPTDLGLFRAAGGHLYALQVDGMRQAPDAAVGIGPGRALVASAGALWLVDASTGAVAQAVGAVGKVFGATRAADGTSWLATALGIVERRPDGTLRRHLLAADPDHAVTVHAVADGGPGVCFAATARGLVRLDHGDPRIVAALPAFDPATGPRSLAVDAKGDVWVSDPSGTLRFHP